MVITNAATGAQQARENREHLRKLLGERQPGFAATLQAAARQIDQELARGGHHPCGDKYSITTS